MEAAERNKALRETLKQVGACGGVEAALGTGAACARPAAGLRCLLRACSLLLRRAPALPALLRARPTVALPALAPGAQVLRLTKGWDVARDHVRKAVETDVQLRVYHPGGRAGGRAAGWAAASVKRAPV